MADIQNKKLWTEEEDQTLRKAVSLINNDKWKSIAKKFEELYFQAYGVVMKRAGKQCRERYLQGNKFYRWYNKLHPDLSKTLAPWSKEESVTLLTIYQQMGPKWAKIIYRLCELGYDRRSDNNIKNHFHMMVKKSLKDLSQFIEQSNQKIKQAMVSKRVKKIYFYEKTYSIQKMMRKQLKKFVENEKVSQQGSNNNRIVQQNVCEGVQEEKQQVTDTKEARMSCQLLRIIDKKSIDRFWLWSAHKSTGRLQILSPAIQDTELLTARNCFIQYMKHPQSLSQQQIKQLIQSINSYTKCCKKLNKRKREKFIKQKQDKTKYYVEKIARRIFASVITQMPGVKKIFVRNKGQIVERIVFLVNAIYSKCAMFRDDEENCKDEIINKKQQQKIIKQIIQEVMEAQEGNKGNSNLDVSDVSIPTIKLKSKQQMQQQSPNAAASLLTQKVKKIRKYNRKKPLQKSNLNKQADKLLQDVVVVKKEQQQSYREQLVQTHPLIYSQIKIQQQDFNMFAFETVQQINSSLSGSIMLEEKQKQVNNNSNNNKVRESYLRQVKVEDNFWSTIKMAEESEKTTEVNHSMGQCNHVHQQQHLKQQQVHANCSFEDKQLILQGKGSFGEIQKMFPDKLVKSIELGQDVYVNKAYSPCINCINPFMESEQMQMPQSKQQPQSNFTFFNQLPQPSYSKNPFTSYNPSPLPSDPFCLLTNSRQFLMNNTHFSNKIGSTQYQILQKPKSPYNSHQFLQLSCENPWKSNNVSGNVGCGEIKKQCDQVGSQQNVNANGRDNDKQGDFFNNSFFENIRNVEEKPQLQWKQPKVFDFEQQKDQLRFPYSRQSREINHFNPFVSQPLDFEIPQKLIESVKNTRFPIKNYNDYSLNYQHANSLQFSKIFELEKSFGLNSARLSQIDLFRSQDRSSSHRSKSKDHEGSSNMFKSQRINSIHDSCQFSRSRHLSNSCTYSNNENKPYGSAKQIGQNSRI